MKITLDMIEAARRAEYDYYQRGRLLGSERHIPTPDPAIRAMLEAAFAKIRDETAATAKPPKLTAIQFRMLRHIPDEGLSQAALGQGYGIGGQIRTLRILALLGLVVETQGDDGDLRFEITDAGRRLAWPDGMR